MTEARATFLEVLQHLAALKGEVVSVLVRTESARDSTFDGKVGRLKKTHDEEFLLPIGRRRIYLNARDFKYATKSSDAIVVTHNNGTRVLIRMR